jgi:signal transduction histidine kinase
MRLPAILLYWLLLLVPTIALGVFGWRLLRQEEMRLAEAAEIARSERAQLVAENLALFLEEARSGIIAGLSEMPPGEARDALDAWTNANPLVRQSFIWRPHAGVILPLGGPGEAQTRFLHRYEKLLSPRGHWEAEVERPAPPPAPAPMRRNASATRAGGASFEDSAPTPTEPTPRQELKQIADEARMANLSQQGFAHERMDWDVMAAEPAPLRELSATAPASARQQRVEVPRVVAFGWIPFVNEKPLSAIAWIELQPGGEIRGAEVDLEAITRRMLAVLPREGDGRELYRLLDQDGEFFPAAEPLALTQASRQLTLGPLLPGWQLLSDSPTSTTGGSRGFFLLSSLLLGVLLTAILSGGSLLLYQAHRHQVDARQKSSFVSNVSHELKTPLTTIRMYAELIGEGRVRDEARQKNYLHVIITESQRLTRLINNVLDFSRLEQGRLVAAPLVIDVTGRLLEVLDMQEIRLSGAGLRLIRDLPATPLFAAADPDALEQAVLNLLDNALKYAAGGGELHVQAAAGSRHVRIHFMDRGPGIEKQQERRLFEKFYRGDPSLTASQPGCGLGLNIARRLLRRNGGDLQYSPRANGGACFTILLPLRNAPRVDDSDRANPQAPGTSAAPLKSDH